MLEAPVVGGVVRIVKECRRENSVGFDSVDAKEVVYPEPYDELRQENERDRSLPSQSVGDATRDSVLSLDLVGDAVLDATSLSDVVGEAVRDSISSSAKLGDGLPRSCSLSSFSSPSVP